MRALTGFVIRRPWLTILVILGITAFFGYEMRYVRIDNEVKNFLPELQQDRQGYMRNEEIFGSEMAAVISIAVDPHGPYPDVFNPRTLQVVQELTDWLADLKIEAPRDHWVWVRPEELAPVRARKHPTGGKCTPALLEELAARETPPDLEGFVKLVGCQQYEPYGAADVVSLATMKVIYDQLVASVEQPGQVEHQLMIADPWKTLPTTQAEADQVRKKFASWELYKNNVVSPDFKAAAIYVQLPSGATIEFSEKLQKLMEQKIAEIIKPNEGLSAEIGGLPMISVWLGKYLQSDLRTLIPFVFIVIVGVLIISFRNKTGVIMPIITLTLATIWTVGFTALCRKPLTIITSALPTLIVTVGSAYAIHVIHSFFELRRAGMPTREGLIESQGRVGMAVVMAGLTTVGGFFSLATSTVVPVKELGYFAAFGTFAALTISLTLVPVMLYLAFRGKKVDQQAQAAENVEHDPSATAFGRFLNWSADFIVRRKTLVLGVGAALLALCIFLATQIKVTSNMVEYFKANSPIRTTDADLSRQFGGTNPFSLVIDGGQEGYWKDPAALRKLDELDRFVKKSFPDVSASLSLLDYIKKMNMALHDDDPAEYRIPDTRQAVANALFLFAQKSAVLESVVDFDFRRARVTFRVRNGQTEYMGQIKRAIDGWIAQQWPEIAGRPAPRKSPFQFLGEIFGLVPLARDTVGEKYHYSGPNYLRFVVDRLVVIGQIGSINFSIVIVFILALIIFRSVVGGLLSVLPTALAVAGNFGVMGILGIPLDVGTALVSAAAVGAGIDYAIHYISRYRIECRLGAEIVPAVNRTHLSVGKAIIFNATAVALGFFVMLFSNFVPVLRMGFLTGLTMFTASFVAMTIIPILLVLLKPRFIRQLLKSKQPNDGGAQ